MRRWPMPEFPDYFRPADAWIDERFAAIAARLRDEADQRICEAHARNMSELPEIDGGRRG